MALAYDKILLFGDSITQGCYNQEGGFSFGAALQTAYSRKLDVITRGFGGYNSDHALLIFDHILKQEVTDKTRIKLMIVFFGTNDCITPDSLNHVPIPRFKENMTKIIHAAENTGAKVIMIGPAPVDHYPFMKAITEIIPGFVSDRHTLRARDYCNAAVELGKELNVPVVPMWDLVMADLDWKDGDFLHGSPEGPAENPLNEYFSDGLHFLGKAYKIQFDGVMKAINESYPHLSPEKMVNKLIPSEEITSLDVLKEALA